MASAVDLSGQIDGEEHAIPFKMKVDFDLIVEEIDKPERTK